MAANDVAQMAMAGTASSAGTSRLVEKHAAQLGDAYRKIRHRQAELEATLEAITSNIALIDKKWEDGRIDMGLGDYKKERNVLIQKQLGLLATVSVTRSVGSELAGRWMDDLATGTREALDDWAYIDAAIRCYPEVPYAKKSVKSTRTQLKEKTFRKELLKSYASYDEDESHIWCPVAQKYIPTAYGVVVATHVVNSNVGDKIAHALFGDDYEHIWNARNGLMISKGYEQLLDSARAVILPVSDAPGETEFRFYLFTKDIGRTKAEVWGDELHERRLVFKNAFRPAKMYLYFKFAISLLRRRRAEVPGHLDDLQDLPNFNKSLWASPGPYIKRSVLYKFSRQLGCLTTAEADQFWGVADTPMELLSEESDDIATTAAVLASTAIGKQVDDNEEEEKEEEEEEEEEE